MSAPGDHVVVSDDLSVGRDDEPRPDTLTRRALARKVRQVAKALAEAAFKFAQKLPILGVGSGRCQGRGHFDKDNRRRDRFHQIAVAAGRMRQRG